MKTKRVFTAEYKQEAARLVLQEKLSMAQVARRLEMSEKTLANWVSLARRGKLNGSSAGELRRSAPVSELEMEVSRLRAENTRLKLEKEILKKATAFFVKESQ